ncbi:MAG: nucleoid-associated protein [Olsenella profusa]
MMHVDHAILHAFDVDTGSAYLSDRELDLGERQVKSYVQRSMRRIVSSAESRHGVFEGENPLADALESYAGGSSGFIEVSQQLAQVFWEELRRCDELEQADLLLADFTDTQGLGEHAKEMGEGQLAQAMACALAPADVEDLSVRYVGAILLPRKLAFVHDLGSDGSGIADNEILRQDATLPNPTQKFDTYLLVNLADGSIDFHDRERAQGGRALSIIAECILRCSPQASSREVVQHVERIVEEVAQAYGTNAVEAVAQAKHMVASSAEREESFSPAEVGRAVFEGQPQLRERYEQATREERLPEEVPVRRSAARRITKSHRIKTDTGIEISFPSEYAADANFIEFTSDAEGMVSILIKNVTHIENR